MLDSDQVRVSAVRALNILDTQAERGFDALVIEAAVITRSPIALISFVDENRQWFKAKVGIDSSETPLTTSFCTHAIRGGGLFEVADARLDDRFRNYALVTGRPNIRFYAGAPLQLTSGVRVGTLCVIDDKPRGALSNIQRKIMLQLAEQTVALVESRRSAHAGRASPTSATA